MLDVVTIGSATLDIFLRSNQFKIDKAHADGVLLCERYEGKIDAQELVMTSGGGATNAAVSYARKGFQVASIVEVGKDPAAEVILSELGKEHVALSYVIQEQDEQTAVSVILLSSAKGNSIVTYRGASRMLTMSDIPFDKLGMSLRLGGWVHLTSVGGNVELVEKVFNWCKEKNRKLFWNPGAAELRNIQHSAPNVIQLNRSEASEFFGIDFTNDEVWKSEHCPAPAGTILIITDGERGGRVCLPAEKRAMSRVRIEPKGEWQAKAGHQGKCSWYQGIKTQMVDSTGAGDAFGSGFVSALMFGESPDEAIEWGKKQAASVVEKIGAKEGLMTREEIEGIVQ